MRLWGSSWDHTSPPLDAVKKFKEVGDFLFQYSILGVRDDAWRLEGVGDWLLGSLRSLMRGYNWRRGVFEKWRPSSMLLAGYSGWPVLVAVVFPDGSERAEGESMTPFFFSSGPISPIPPGENAPTRLKKIVSSCCDSELWQLHLIKATM